MDLFPLRRRPELRRHGPGHGGHRYVNAVRRPLRGRGRELAQGHPRPRHPRRSSARSQQGGPGAPATPRSRKTCKPARRSHGRVRQHAIWLYARSPQARAIRRVSAVRCSDAAAGHPGVADGSWPGRAVLQADFTRPTALGAVGARRGGLRLGRRSAPAPRHAGLGHERAGKQAGDRQVRIGRFPMRARAGAEDLGAGEMVLGRVLQPPPDAAGRRRCGCWRVRRARGRAAGRSARPQRAVPRGGRPRRGRARRRSRRRSTQP